MQQEEQRDLEREQNLLSIMISNERNSEWISENETGRLLFFPPLYPPIEELITGYKRR